MTNKKEYYLIERQNQGCDYTIGCGIRISQLYGATSMEEAIKQAIGDIDQILEEDEIDEDDLHDYILDNHSLLHYYHGDYEYSIDEAEILEVTRSIDLDDLIRKAQVRLNNIQQELIDKKKEEKDRARYEELKKRFEKS